MHSRQSGAAHVPLMFFLITMVVLLGTGGWAYVVTDENSNLRAQISEVKEENRKAKGMEMLLSHYVEDINSVFKQPGTYQPRSSVSSEIYAEQNLDGVEGVMSPTALQAKIDELGTQIGISKTNGLDDLVNSIANKMAALEKRAADAEAARDGANAAKAATDTQFASSTAAHSRAAGEWRQSLEQARSDYNSGVAGRDSTISQLQENVRDKDDALNTEQEERASERKKLQGEIGTLKMHNSALVNKDRLRNPTNVVDGQIISARRGLKTAFISLGKKDMLQAGTVFRIKNKGSDDIKAYATVTENIEQDRAEVQLTAIVDELGDPVRRGDNLFNDLYTPGKYNKRTIYLMGRFSYPYNKPQLVELLENLGNTVVMKLQPGVDTVILGNSVPTADMDGIAAIEDTDEYKQAVEWGVEFAPLRKIRDLIKL